MQSKTIWSLVGASVLILLALGSLAAVNYLVGGVRTPEILLTLVLILGVIALVTVIGALVSLLRPYGMLDPHEALALPTGEYPRDPRPNARSRIRHHVDLSLLPVEVRWPAIDGHRPGTTRSLACRPNRCDPSRTAGPGWVSDLQRSARSLGRHPATGAAIDHRTRDASDGDRRLLFRQQLRHHRAEGARHSAMLAANPQSLEAAAAAARSLANVSIAQAERLEKLKAALDASVEVAPEKTTEEA